MSRTTLGVKHQLYRERIVNSNVAADQPVFGAENSRELGILVYNPGNVAMDIEAYSVHQVSGKINSIPVGAAGVFTIVSDVPTGLRNGDTVEIGNTTTSPSSNGSYVVSNVTARTFDITLGFDIVHAGVGAFKSPLREYMKVAESITGSTELIADHVGGAYRIKVVNIVGAPLSAANAIDIFVRAL